MMKKYAYPEADKHGDAHNELRYKVLSINYDDIGNLKEFYQNTYTYLSNWLINHIMETDKELGAYLAAKAI
jgi:hemerythrin-like metal-binding protein